MHSSQNTLGNQRFDFYTRRGLLSLDKDYWGTLIRLSLQPGRYRIQLVNSDNRTLYQKEFTIASTREIVLRPIAKFGRQESLFVRLLVKQSKRKKTN